MPLETGTYISDLVVTNPTATDGMAQGDDHLRLLKSVIKATLPNFTAAALTSTQAQIDAAVQKIVTDNAFVPPGAMMPWPKTQSNPGWLRCDGTVYTIATYPALGAYLGSSFGGDGITTFGVPNLEDTGRFLRSVTAGLAAGTAQANQNKQHTHTYSGTTNSTGAHTHSLSVSSSVTDPGHGHDLILNGVQGGSVNVGVPTGAAPFSGGNPQCTSQSLSVAHNTTGITVSSSGTANSAGAHSHTVSGTTDADGGTETRPEAFAAVYYIKT